MSWVLAPAEELLPVLVAKPTMPHQKSAHRSAQGRQRHACSCERGQVTKKSEHLVKSNKPAVTSPCINNQRVHVVIVPAPADFLRWWSAPSHPRLRHEAIKKRRPQVRRREKRLLRSRLT